MSFIFNPPTAASIGAVPTSRQVIAGTNMSGGGTLAADRTFNASGGTSAPAITSGNWFQPLQGTVVASSGTCAVDTIYLIPFYLPAAVTISALAANLATAIPVSNVQLAIYATTAAGKPTGNVLAATGSIASTATGFINGALSGGNVTLPAGLYYFAANTSIVGIVFQSIANAFAYCGNLIGDATLSNLASSSTVTTIQYSVAQTFGTWPDLTAVTPTKINNANRAPFPYMKVA